MTSSNSFAGTKWPLTVVINNSHAVALPTINPVWVDLVTSGWPLHLQEQLTVGSISCSLVGAGVTPVVLSNTSGAPAGAGVVPSASAEQV